MALGLTVAIVQLLGFIAIVIMAMREKRLYITTAFDLRTLPHGEQFTHGDGSQRLFSIVDAQHYAFPVYEWLSFDKRRWFISLSDFIHYVAGFDPTLLDTLRARTVNPAEYELDRSGWEDDGDEEDDN